MNMFIYVMTLLTALLITYFSTPISKWISIKMGGVAQPRQRDMHTKPMPRMGGIAIVFGFMCTIILFVPKVEGFGWREIWGLVVGGLIIFLLGFFDDIYVLKAKPKLIIQIIATLIVIYSGIRIDFITWPFGNGEIITLGLWSIPITLFWIIGITNALNLIDGLDGLAAGVSTISAITLMILSIIGGNDVAVVITVAIVGSCLGFLPYNFNPAKIFMGDTGAPFLGFILSIASIQGLFKVYTVAAIVVAVFVLGLPIFDTTFAILRRLKNGKPIMEADRGHLHHRLIDRGYSQKKSVLILYSISSAFGILAILVAERGIYYGAGVFFIMIVIGIIIWAPHKNIEQK